MVSHYDNGTFASGWEGGLHGVRLLTEAYLPFSTQGVLLPPGFLSGTARA